MNTSTSLSSDLNRQILSDVAVHMKYAKYSPELKRRESFEEIIDRNKEMNIKKFPFLKEEIEKNYVNVYAKKNLPSMRSLQFGGKPIEITPSRIYNCSYLPIDDYRAFSEAMFLLLGGVGVGYSVQQHHIDKLPEIQKPSKDKRLRRFLISDSIEGWADAIKVLMKSYFFGGSPINFDYSDIRPKGALLVTSGGKAPGPDPLKYCIETIRTLLESKSDGDKLKSVEVHDIVCHIADAVLAGGIRRAALISLFSKEDEKMLLTKGNFEVLNWDYAMVDAGVDQHGEPRKAKVEHILNGEKYFDLRLVYKDPSYGIIETVCYWVSEKDIETYLKPESKLPWYCFQPQRGRANNSVVLERDKITETEFKNLWKTVENSKAGEPGFYLTNNKDWGTNPCCFVGDTSIRTDEGEMKISDIVKKINNGEKVKVWTYNEDTGAFEFNFVREGMLTNENSKVVTLTFECIPKSITETFSRLTNKVTCTIDHKFYTRKRGWVEAYDLSSEDELIIYNDNDKTVNVAKCILLENENELVPVYDIEVENNHNFFANGVLAHNCEISLKPNSFCNLCEVNMLGVSSQEDLNERVRSAAFIGTLQASYTDFHYLRPIWQKTAEKDALLGIGLTGIASCDYKNLDFTEAANIAVEENKRVANLIGINPAARVTTIKPSGTSSTVLGTSSGIHAWHNDYYLRRIRVKKNESIYTYLLINHPELVEDDVMDVAGSAVISVPIKAPENSILRTESPLETLERIKYFYNNWILPGHNTGDNTHNISATISIKPEEWESVGNWMWTNRDCYNGISVLDYDGGTYKQAPFEDITKEEYERLTEQLTRIDLSNVVELEDNTNLNGEVACAGGACEVAY